MTRYPRLDGPQREIVDALRARGVRCESTAALGRGRPDVLAYRPAIDRLRWLEIKAPTARKARRRMPAQVLFAAQWRGAVVQVDSVAEALAAMGLT